MRFCVSKGCVCVCVRVGGCNVITWTCSQGKGNFGVWIWAGGERIHFPPRFPLADRLVLLKVEVFEGGHSTRLLVIFNHSRSSKAKGVTCTAARRRGVFFVLSVGGGDGDLAARRAGGNQETQHSVLRAHWQTVTQLLAHSVDWKHWCASSKIFC